MTPSIRRLLLVLLAVASVLSVGPAQALLGVNQLIGFGAGISSAPASVTFTDSTVSGADATVYTFSTQDIGTAGANRHVIVLIHAGDLSGSTGISSVTVGGIAASSAVTHGDTIAGTSFTTAIFIAAVPTGTTADVVVTFAAGRSRAGIGVYAAYDLINPTPPTTQS